MASTKYWIALFSHSGEELNHVARTMMLNNKNPSLILSDQTNRSKVVADLVDATNFRTHQEIMNIIVDLSDIAGTDHEIIITLHGYMRIIPPEIIALPNVRIYNVHPGDIVKYPELRGKDPQEKALELGLDTTGVVIHAVDEGVDTGKVIDRSVYIINETETLSSLIVNLRYLSVSMWVRFLENIL